MINMNYVDDIQELRILRNHMLFELEKPFTYPLHPELLKFLNESIYPWVALGKNLTEFVTKLVDSVPANQRIQGNVSPQCFLENKESIVIEPGAIVEAGAYICGPTYIEAGAVIRHGAYIRGSVFISKHAIVGHTTEVKGSILLPKAAAAHFNYVGDSILGRECNLGAGTKLANLKFTHGDVLVKMGNEKYETGLKKFGAVFGNRAQTGCNAVTNPGTILFPDKNIMPNQTGQHVIL